MEKPTTETRGGKRPGAGRKKTEETVLKSFRLNQEALNRCLVLYGRGLSGKVNEFIKSLAGEDGQGKLFINTKK